MAVSAPACSTRRCQLKRRADCPATSMPRSTRAPIARQSDSRRDTTRTGIAQQSRPWLAAWRTPPPPLADALGIPDFWEFLGAITDLDKRADPGQPNHAAIYLNALREVVPDLPVVDTIRGDRVHPQRSAASRRRRAIRRRGRVRQGWAAHRWAASSPSPAHERCLHCLRHQPADCPARCGAPQVGRRDRGVRPWQWSIHLGRRASDPHGTGSSSWQGWEHRWDR